MTTKPSIPHATALEHAERLCAILAPACDLIVIAGSVRRRKAHVGDIELVAVPKWEADLLGNPTQLVMESLLKRVIADGVLSRVVSPGERAMPDGPKYKRLIVCDLAPVALDLFMGPASNHGLRLAIRTGPAGFSHALVMPRTQSFLDSNGQRCSGLLPAGWSVYDGNLRNAGQIIDTPDERVLLETYAGGWIEPEDRR